MLLSIISLNFKKPQLTVTSMRSLYREYKKEFDTNLFEYIVVDNCSGDDSSTILSREVKKYKNFQFIENKKNSGFGAGNNFAVTFARGEYLLFLNNDTEIQGNDILHMLTSIQNHKEIGILGGQLKNFDGTLQISVGTFFTFFPTLLLLLGKEKFGFSRNPTTMQQVDWVKGALLMISKDLFDKLKGFDEGIFMYTEDMELCFRAKKLGYKSYFYPTDGILHKDHGSSDRTFAIVNIYKNLLYFSKKHRSVWEYSLIKLLLQTKAIFLILYGKLSHKSYFVETYEKALNATR